MTCPDVGDNQPKGWLIPHVDTPWKGMSKVAIRVGRGVRPISYFHPLEGDVESSNTRWEGRAAD